MTLSRRNLIKVLGASGTASVLFSREASALPVGPDTKWTNTYDVVIIGGGISGMYAAVSAKESGAKSVLVVEKNPTLFLGSSTYSGGLASAAGTRTQARAGIKDPGPEVFAKEIMKAGKGLNDETLVRLYVENSAAAIDYLEDLGVKFRLVPNAAFSVLRMHNNGTRSGARIIQALDAQAKKLGVAFAMSTEALKLLTNNDSSEVLGVQVRNKEKQIANIRAEKAVIIASGGYMGNPALVDKFLPRFKGALSCSSPASQGSGLLMAAKIGAQLTHMEQGAVYAYGAPVDQAKRRGLLFRGHVFNLYGSITVGTNGKRFIADEASATTAANAAFERGFDRVYVIATKEMLDRFMEKEATQVSTWSREKWLNEIQKDHTFSHEAKTIPELAKLLDLPPKNLEETIKRYDEFVKNGEDKDFHRTRMNGTFEKGPFFGFIAQKVAMASTGGLKVNDKLQVLDVYDTPIKHLYAAGEVVGGIHGASYLGGDSVGAAMTFGRLAGMNGAKD